MLQEYGITPQVFSKDALAQDPSRIVLLKFLLGAIAESGLVANLEKGAWIKAVDGARSELSQNLALDLMKLLNVLKDRNRIVKHPSGGFIAEDEQGWLQMAQLATPDLDRIVVTNKDLLTPVDERVVKIDDVLDEGSFSTTIRSKTLDKRAEEFKPVLEPILRHARIVQLVDPYFNPHRTEYMDTISLVISLLDRDPDGKESIVEIHAGNPRVLGEPKEEPVNRLAHWNVQFARLKSPKRRIRFRVCLWNDRDSSRRFHDRYVLTDQCGIATPGGLDVYPNHRPAAVSTWSLLGQQDVERIRLLIKAGIIDEGDTADVKWTRMAEDEFLAGIGFLRRN